MRRPRGALFGLFGPLLLWTACASAPGATGTTATADSLPPQPVEVKIFALSDFHGWLFPRLTRSNPRFYGGIANIGAFLRHREGVDPLRSILLDNGDMWTGPVESTVLKGEPVVAAYNALGLTAANVANHEFDFGPAELRKRASEAHFAFLGANIIDRRTNRAPTFIQPWVIVERQGVKVGVLGLSFRGTPQTTSARNVEGLEFLDYPETLRVQVPKMMKAGAEVIVVLLHDQPTVARSLVQQIGGEVPIHLVVAGQDHRKFLETTQGVPVVNPGPFGASYAKFIVRFDRRRRAVMEVIPEIVDVTGSIQEPPFPPATDLLRIAERAREKTEALANQELGRLDRPLPVGSFVNSPLGQFIVDSWLSALTEQVDLAMLNHGGVRQPLPAGPVTLADIRGVMPFENNIYIVRLTGNQIKAQLEIDHPVVAGFSWTFEGTEEDRKVIGAVDRRGQPIEDATTYRVAILDFMYTGGDGFQFAKLDEAPVDTGLSWREPVIRAFREAKQTQRSIDPHVGPRARRLR